MAGYDGRGAKFPLTIVRGADMAFTVTATDSDAAAIDLSAATIAGEVYSTDGTLVDTFTHAVSGTPTANIITLSFTDTETTALTSDAYTWTLWVTRGGDTRPWLAGPVRVTTSTNGGPGTSGTAVTATVDSNVNVSVSVAVVGSSDYAPRPAVDGTVGQALKILSVGPLVTEWGAVSAGADAPVVVTGTTDTLAAGDGGKVNIYSDASLVTVTLPTDAADDLDDGFECLLVAAGAAGITVDTTGLTILGGSSSATAAQGSSIYVKKTDTANTWLVLAPSEGQTAAGILAALLTVDGSGSGLDADLLDGNDASAFATSAQGALADSALQSANSAVATVTDTADTLAAGDDSTMIIYSAAGAVTVTLANLTVGHESVLVSTGAGGLTVADGGMTILGSSPNLSIAQNEALFVKQTADSTWIVLGGTA